MALETFELIANALRQAPIAAAVESAVRALPPVTPERPRKALDFAPVIGVKQGVVFEALAEFDDPVHNAADLIPILDLDPQGALAQELLAIDGLIADIKD